jgi:Tfp pilus assembly protein PilO
MAFKRTSLTAACVAAALVLPACAGAAMHWHLLSSRRAAIAAVDAEARRVAQQNAATERAGRELPQLRATARRLARRVPPDPELGTLLGSVGTDASASGAPEREIVTRQTIPGQPVARVPFLLQYRGSFATTLTLLRRLQEVQQLTQVERLVIENESTTDGDKPLRVQVEFSTFARTSKELEAWSQAE